MDFAHESYISVKDEIRPLLQQHWQEIALHTEDIKLDPEWSEYSRLASLGALRVYTARKSSELVGYFVCIVMPSLHYRTHLFANNDILFLKKSERKGTAGIRLIKFAIEELKKDGVTLINVNVKKKQDFGKVLDRLGFDHIEDLWQLKVK